MKQVVLYNHNKTTYENIVRIFENDNKCAAVQPTGSGKSFLIFKLAQDNFDKTVVVFEPNKQIIGRVTEQMKEYGIDNIQFYTYQKLNSQHKRDEITIDNVDYICLDELHRIKAKQWGQAVDAIRDKFPNAKVLGLTATPERMDGQNIVDYFGAELACNITLGDAIVNKILPCPTYISALYTFDEEVQRVYDKINESRNSDEEKEEMRAELETARKQLENALGVPKILEKHIPNKNGKYIVFCQNVEHLNTMQSVIEDWFISAGFEIHTYSVHSKNPNRKTEYKAFQTDNSDCIKLCLCIDMFNEGVHLKGITGVILLRPTQSSIIYFQQIGRAISASDENIPIIFDLVNNGNCLGGGNLRTEIESTINKQRDNEKQNKEKGVDVFDIGDFHIYDYITESLNIFSNIEDKCFDNWYYYFNQFCEFKNKFGHGNVEKEYSEQLYRWCCMQRFEKLTMNNDKFELLDKNGFIWDIRYYKWLQKLSIVSEYMLNFNNKITENTNYKGLNLMNWIYNNKTLYKQGKLSEQQIEMLNKHNLLISHDEVWDNKFLLVKEYLLKHKKLKSKTIYKGVKIGYWYGTQFTLFNQNKLEDYKINKLKSLGLLKSIDEEEWFYYYNILVECKNQDIKVLYNTEYMGEKVGRWICRQKDKYKQGKLSEEKANLLKLVYDLDLDKKKIWDDKFFLLQEYLLTQEKLCYNSVYKNIKIGQWYGMQFKLYNRGKLQTNQINKLKSLGLLTPKKEELWNDFITVLKKCINDHIVINSKTIYNNKKIGQNLFAYRRRYKNGTFPECRYQQLLDLGIDLAKKGSIM